MGRVHAEDNLSLIHPVLYLSFLAAGLAASIAIVTAICSGRFRKKSSPPPTSSDPLEPDITKELMDPSIPPSTMADTAISPENTTDTENSDAMPAKELPLPPAMQQPTKDSCIPSDNMKRAASERRQSFSLSLKVPRSLSTARNWDHREDNDGGRKKGKSKAEDSVWMKTIILGEKCVPDEEEDAVIYEGKGKKISAYHPKNASSISVSRQCSFIDPDALPVPQTQTHIQLEERFNNI